MLRVKLLSWYKWPSTFRVYGFLEAEMCGERNDTIPGGPPRVANEHEDSGIPNRASKMRRDYELAHIANAFSVIGDKEARDAGN
jgi:hypothetical protein